MPMHKLLKEIKLYMKINYFKKKEHKLFQVTWWKAHCVTNFYLKKKKNYYNCFFFNFYYWLNFDKLLGAF